MFVYTDGVPEATNAVKAMFRAELLIDTLNRDANASPEELIHRVHEEVKLFTGHAPQFDDMTMLCCEYRG